MRDKWKFASNKFAKSIEEGWRAGAVAVNYKAKVKKGDIIVSLARAYGGKIEWYAIRMLQELTLETSANIFSEKGDGENTKKCFYGKKLGKGSFDEFSMEKVVMVNFVQGGKVRNNCKDYIFSEVVKKVNKKLRGELLWRTRSM